MAKIKNGKSLVVKQETTSLALPDYIKGNEQTGMEALGKDDFKVTRIKLLQPLNPEVRTFSGKAIPGEFWHTGVNQSLGAEFIGVPILISKKVVVWPPDQDIGSPMLAYSKDGVHWQTGGNMVHEVAIKGSKEPRKIFTGKNVADSGLLNFGTEDPTDTNSPPLATLFYDYLLFLPDHPQWSPVVMSMYRTSVSTARNLNTYMLSRRIPINCNRIKFFSEEDSKDKYNWFAHRFDPSGNALKEEFEITEKMKETYGDYEVDVENVTAQKMSDVVGDKIPF